MEKKNIIRERGKWGMHLGLERIEFLLDYLGNPQKDLNIIHVAGSNGKGSVVRILESILKEAGIRVGTFTSPAMENDNDRIRVNMQMIDDKTLGTLLDTVLEASRALEEKTGERATGFELETAIAFLYFKQQKIDIAVIEVGLGGRLDATNVIKNPLITIITHIALEHTKYLGNTLSEIAAEKGAIIKENANVIIAPQEEEAKLALEEIIEEHDLKTTSFLEENQVNVIKNSLSGQILEIGDKRYDLSLLGDFQQINLLTALKAVDILRTEGYAIEEEKLKKALSSIHFPGRFELFSKKPKIIIDGAHNTDGINHLVKNLESYDDTRHVFIYGMLEEKDPEKSLDLLINCAKKFYLLEPQNPDALKSERLKELIQKKSDVEVVILDEYEDVIDIIRNFPEESYVVSGSLYLISKLRPILKFYSTGGRT